MRDFHQLDVWRRAHQLVVAVHRATDTRPRAPSGLTGQLRRAAMSIPTNIAEGCGHDTRREYARFLAIASASAVEVEYLLLLARDLGQLTAPECEALARETVAIRRMCRTLRHRILAESDDR